MADSKKGKGSSKKAKSPKAAGSGKELSADELENVSGGLLPAVNIGADKYIKMNDSYKIDDASHKIIGPVDIVAPALKK